MIPMLILFNANGNSLHLKVMKFIIFLFASIGCHLGWLYYQPSAPFVVQFNQAQPAKRIAVNIIKSQPVKQSVTNLNYEFNPVNNPYIDLAVRFGNTQSHVTETDGKGMLEDYIGVESHYEYNINTLDIMNTSALGMHALTYGLQ